jgi:hypothetical protein
VPPVAVHVKVTPLRAVPLESLAVALKLTAPPVVVLALVGVSAIEAIVDVGALTVTDALPEIEPLEAVTLNVPAVEPAV